MQQQQQQQQQQQHQPTLLEDWKIFKKTWNNRIEKDGFFEHFDEYITSEKWKDMKYSNQIKKIYIIDNSQNCNKNIELKQNILYINTSPFTFNYDDHNKHLPIGFLLEQITDTLVENIKNSCNHLSSQDIVRSPRLMDFGDKKK